jgi:hypothetical protein
MASHAKRCFEPPVKGVQARLFETLHSIEQHQAHSDTHTVPVANTGTSHAILRGALGKKLCITKFTQVQTSTTKRIGTACAGHLDAPETRLTHSESPFQGSSTTSHTHFTTCTKQTGTPGADVSMGAWGCAGPLADRVNHPLKHRETIRHAIHCGLPCRTVCATGTLPAPPLMMQ